MIFVTQRTLWARMTTVFFFVLEVINTICKICNLYALVESLFLLPCSQTTSHSSSAPWTAACVCLPDWESREASPNPHLMAHCPGLTSESGNQCLHQLASKIMDALRLWSGHIWMLNNFPFFSPSRWPMRSGLFVSCPVWRWW